MSNYAFMAPESIDDALGALAAARSAGEPVQPLAGGTDLIVQLRGPKGGPRRIVDLKRIPDFTRIEAGDAYIEIGAAANAVEVKRHPAVAGEFPGLAEAIDLIGSTQIQGRATLGGNLCNASPAGDTIPALIANGAICRIIGPAGERTLPVEAFVVGVQRNALEAGELLLSLRLPRAQPRTADAYLRFIPRTEMDIAVAGAGVSLTLDPQGVCCAARVAIGAVAPTALLVPAAAAALEGSTLDDDALAAAAAAASAAADPITDKRGTAEYRRKVVGVLVRRAALQARQRVETA